MKRLTKTVFKKVTTLLPLFVLGISSVFAETQTEIEYDSLQNYDRGLPLVASINAEKNPHRDWIWETEEEPYDTGWALYVDNDLFALRDSDKDYTGGISLTLAGKRATEYAFSIDPVLKWVDSATGFESLRADSDRHLHSLEMGFTVFTPEVITEREAQLDDRPYASLLFLSNTHESIDFETDSALISSFSIGVLGSKLISEVQTQVHKSLGSDEPVGWDNQISDGGELTFRYSIAKQSLFHYDYEGDYNLEVSTTSQASVGYITEASFGMAARVGDFNTPWYSFRPQFNDYSEKSASLAGLNEPSEEFYYWGGFNLHLRAYNAFLQGQFRDSDHVFHSDQVRRMVADAWVGVTKQFASGWRLSYLLRGQSSEVKEGNADRSVVWGGLIISKGW